MPSSPRTKRSRSAGQGTPRRGSSRGSSRPETVWVEVDNDDDADCIRSPGRRRRSVRVSAIKMQLKRCVSIEPVCLFGRWLNNRLVLGKKTYIICRTYYQYLSSFVFIYWLTYEVCELDETRGKLPSLGRFGVTIMGTDAFYL